MYGINDISQVRNSIEKHIGSKIKLEANKKKQKASVSEGVIENTYPSIFIVQLYEGAAPSRRVSFSYADILTKEIKLTLI